MHEKYLHLRAGQQLSGALVDTIYEFAENAGQATALFRRGDLRTANRRRLTANARARALGVMTGFPLEDFHSNRDEQDAETDVEGQIEVVAVVLRETHSNEEWMEYLNLARPFGVNPLDHVGVDILYEVWKELGFSGLPPRQQDNTADVEEISGHLQMMVHVFLTGT